jgi:3-hydroxyacyl-[acyl-carrier-protein] dehydratase
MNVADIKRILPHRYPILLVDEVVEAVVGQRLVARKAVTANEPWYARLGAEAETAQHAYPSVLLVESWCQAAGLLATWHQPSPDALSGRVMLVASVTRARLRDTVMPGAVIEHRIRKVRELDQAVVFDGESTVGGRVVLDIERIVMTLRPADELGPVTEWNGSRRA